MNYTNELTELIGKTTAEGLSAALCFNSEFYSDRYSEEYTFIPAERDYRRSRELSLYGVYMQFNNDMSLAK